MLGKKSRVRRRVTSEINITPFTDVVLVLLIIFMITTPLMMESKQRSDNQGADDSGFSVQLPKGTTRGIPGQAAHLVVAILQDGRLVIGGEEVSEDAVKDRLQKAKAENPDVVVVVQADRMVNHWRVVQVMEEAAQLGLGRLAIATVEEDAP